MNKKESRDAKPGSRIDSNVLFYELFNAFGGDFSD